MKTRRVLCALLLATCVDARALVTPAPTPLPPGSTAYPTASPTKHPTAYPTKSPTPHPTLVPTPVPTHEPTPGAQQPYSPSAHDGGADAAAQGPDAPRIVRTDEISSTALGVIYGVSTLLLMCLAIVVGHCLLKTNRNIKKRTRPQKLERRDFDWPTMTTMGGGATAGAARTRRQPHMRFNDERLDDLNTHNFFTELMPNKNTNSINTNAYPTRVTEKSMRTQMSHEFVTEAPLYDAVRAVGGEAPRTYNTLQRILDEGQDDWVTLPAHRKK